MKKIMFNDKYGLTQAVLEGRKTQTRRISRISKHQFELLTGVYPKAPKQLIESVLKSNSRYYVGEIVAVAQSYKDLGFSDGEYEIHKELVAGWNNKMFVRAELCKHQICITNVRVERLQDISDKDCINEGITEPTKDFPWYSFGSKSFLFNEPQQAYSALIDKVIGKGTYESNPYVFVYDFELVK